MRLQPLGHLSGFESQGRRTARDVLFQFTISAGICFCARLARLPDRAGGRPLRMVLRKNSPPDETTGEPLSRKSPLAVGRERTARSRGLRPLRSRLGTRLNLVRAVIAPRRPRQERSSSRAGRTRLGCSPRASARGSPWWRARRPCRNRSLSRLCLRDELAGIFIRADVLRVRGAHSKIARVATPGGRRRGRALRLRCKGFNGRDRAGRRTRSSLSPCGRQAG